MRIKIAIIIFFALINCIPNYTNGQAVYENTEAPVIGFLQRLAQKGKVHINDIILPLSRLEIQKALDSLVIIKKSLSLTEQKELTFYTEEYPVSSKRWTSIHVKENAFILHVDPLVNYNHIQGNNISVNETSNGVQIWGQHKQWGFQMYYRDWTQSGKGLQQLDSLDNFSSKTERVLVGMPTSTTHNFSEVRANISYNWKNGTINLGKLPMSWGYGEMSKIVLSTKSPSFPAIKLNYQPLRWLSFNYFHAWLNSNIIDPSKSYATNSDGVSGNQRIVYIPKFIAMHSVQVEPMKGLQLAMGESIVYSDQVDPGFLIPLSFYKVYDNNRSNYSINAGSNGQLFFQVNSRNQLKNTHLYGTLFIDEIRFSQVFNKSKSRNQIGWMLGGSLTDLIVPYLTLGVEYSRINPFVYQNLLPAQSYTNYSSSLGDWMGNNADRFCFFMKYNPLPKLQLNANFQKIRKGITGSIYDQYLASPQPTFLAEGYNSFNSLFFQASYEWKHNIYLQGSFTNTNHNNLVQLGISLGLR